MKLKNSPRLFLVRTVAFVWLISTSVNCSKKEESPQPLSLPPETTNGAMTFGCKINGEIFTNSPGSTLSANYENRVTGPDKGWFFSTSVSVSGNRYTSVEIGTDSLQLLQGANYQISALDPDGGNAYGIYFIDKTTGFELFNAAPQGSGNLFITKLDEVNKIISGTFSFTCYNNLGILAATITEGRFDVRY